MTEAMTNRSSRVAREAIESFALWIPDVWRTRPARFLRSDSLYVLTEYPRTDRDLPGRVVMSSAIRESLRSLTSADLANVAPWWVKLVIEGDTRTGSPRPTSKETR